MHNTRIRYCLTQLDYDLIYIAITIRVVLPGFHENRYRLVIYSDRTIARSIIAWQIF